MKLGAALATACLAFLILSSAVASAGTTRNLPLENGLNVGNFKVKDNSDGLPPAIVLSTRPAKLDCRVSSYHYGSIQREGKFNVRLRCRNLPDKAIARFTFRAPYKRSFPLNNGSHTLRIAIDKPRGNVKPLGSLTTRPRKTNCDVTPTGSKVGAFSFKAAARITCRDVSAGARGVLGVGGLVSPDYRTGRASGTSPSRASVASVSLGEATTAPPERIGARAPDAWVSADQCDDEKRVGITGQKTLIWKDCYSGPFRLEPWESQFIGISLYGPQFSCSDGFQRSLSWTTAPAAYLLVADTKVRMSTDPDNAYWYSWSNLTGLVTNWQFSGGITFRFVYRCFKTEGP